MSIYIPRHFTGDDATGRELIVAYPFATLVTTTNAGPHVTHLPLLLGPTGRTLVGHVARVNPHWQHFDKGDTIAVFHGPHAFVSRGWYRDPADNVPTWNYAAVHVSGRPRQVDEAQSRAAVEQLTARFEPQGLPPMNEEKLARLLGGIVAFHLRIERLEVKLKMSQNKPEEVAGVIKGLRETGRHDDIATADYMGRIPSPRTRGEG
ncbi:MAG TPA: FMN-binding negative transcriptional regulator [Verrucomicrobiae bacterium]|nr:FMN-binding negative transcriptional regulator [Verrucomicrobiae bacterium]